MLDPALVRHFASELVLRAGTPWVRAWPDYSRLLLVGDQGGWSLDEDMRALGVMSRRLGHPTHSGGWERVARRQCVFYASQFVLLQPLPDRNHRRCFAYFHGYPGTGVEEFDAVLDRLRSTQHQWARIQVSHTAFRDFLLEQGIARDRLRLIPIGIRLPWFQLPTAEQRKAERIRWGVPEQAFVVGSFQKDGNGWGEGRTPKLIKGPDVLVRVLTDLSRSVKELFVLLSGPARGYVKEGLAAAGIPFRHVFLKDFRDLPPLYHALDAYLVTSRQEGGPKAVLEAMASGVPLVTTRVGQAMDIVQHGHNGLMSEVDDVESLVASLAAVYAWSPARRAQILQAARLTAEDHAWDQQGPLWRDFFSGVVEAR